MRLEGNERLTSIASRPTCQLIHGLSNLSAVFHDNGLLVIVTLYLLVITGPTGMDLWQLLLTVALAGSSDAFSGSEGELCFFFFPTPSILKQQQILCIKSELFGWFS